MSGNNKEHSHSSKDAAAANATTTAPASTKEGEKSSTSTATAAADPSKSSSHIAHVARRVAIRIAIMGSIAAVALLFLRPIVIKLPASSSLGRPHQMSSEEQVASSSFSFSLPEAYTKVPTLMERRYRNFFNYSSPEARAAREEFIDSYSPNGEYGYNSQIDTMVVNELTRMDEAGHSHVYLDYTGSGVYQNSQLEKAFNDIRNNLYGNAHSRSPSALKTEKEIENARDLVLSHFHTSRQDYTVIFTQGATGALKLIGESFPWTNASKFVYLRQNHNSVLGIREIALDQGATFVAIPESELNENTCNFFIGGDPCKHPDDQGEEGVSFLEEVPVTQGPANHRRNVLLTKFPDSTYNLFAYPLEDNFAGVKYPLEWIKMFKDERRGEAGTGHWLTVIDAAAFVPCNDLNLSENPADFVTVSFYKMFGYPTGIGALLVRNEVTEIMQKTFFGGGTVVLSCCDTHFCLLQQQPCHRFEDGTPSFLAISELKYGFEKLHALGMSSITQHVWTLTRYLYDQLSVMEHDNGNPVFVIYGKHELNDPNVQGSILNFNVLDPAGNYVGYSTIQDITAKANIHIRTGCNCNPGACFDYLHLSSEEVVKYSLGKTSCGDELDLVEGRPLGGVRVSIGYLTTFEDVYSFVTFAKHTLRNFVASS
ncbi:molybdenum cofactor sulfurase [Pelomyxa schiedti]|nr:molybdenum cofactor sulfurase [Pelomyxa schiedti]